MTRAAGSLLGLVAALATAGVLGAQSPDAPLDAELVRRALAGTTDPADWTMLEEDALTAAAGPFVLRDVGVAEASVLELGLAGYGLPTLDQGLKPGEPTRVVVSLPGARSVFPHGYELAESGDFTSVRVQQGPDGIQVVALLPPGRVAVIEEVAEGVRIRPVAAALTPDAPAAASLPAVPAPTLVALSDWFQLLRAGGPHALLPLGGVAALTLVLLAGWLGVRMRGRAGEWGRATDAQRLADRLAAAIES